MPISAPRPLASSTAASPPAAPSTTRRAASPWRSRGAATVLAVAACVGGEAASCGGDRTPPAGPWTLDTAAVSGPARPRSDSVRVDLFVDATVSMGGYVADPNSRYTQFLEGLESTALNTWRRADVHFYRFGEQQREMTRASFLAAKTPGFYTEKITGIDHVVDCPAAGSVRVIVTDLFQSEGDVNAIVAQIKDRCFQRGRTAAVLGVPSQFNGRVYDAKVPAYAYASTAAPATFRPFYALLLGDPAAVDLLAASLSDRVGGDRAGGAATGGDRLPYVTVGPYVVRQYRVAMHKAPGTREINEQTPVGPYEFSAVLRKGEGAGTMVADVTPTAAPGAFPVRAEQLELAAYRRTVGRGAAARPDSTEVRDVTLQGVTAGKDAALHLTLAVAPPAAAGTYAYKLSLQTAAAGGFVTPPWVDQYSSTNPTPGADANRTLNLAGFVRDLRRAASSVVAPRIAVWYLTVRKL